MQTTNHTSLKVTESPEYNELFDQRAKLLGYIWSVMMTSKNLKNRRFEILETLINPAFRHGYVTVLFNTVSEPVAYFIWAYLTPDVEERIMRTGTLDLHLSEWNEGEQLWILDCAVRKGYFSSVVKQHLLTAFPAETTARYYKQRGNKIIWKEIDRVAVERLARSV